MTHDTTQFKKALEEELAIVEGELTTLGVHNPENPSDWEATPPPNDEILAADDSEVADRMEVYEEKTGVLKQLEIRYNEIRAALDRINQSSYGTCSVCNEPIEEERLKANPAATTCMKHMN